ncbi:zinc finger and BTB domain-containing protein 40 isoform X2 [Hoplias malabaricus]|uniref:zinc finger and BTB domain-containing protein 40 isoform X2 n=1 Tax=Hoplias malabaricus TaxID=27720 RepID=UPI0034627163
MELPNCSRQLMQQLQTLRKESHFCDCTILVGAAPHPAHKVVLAASSLLLKSLLESSDSISIDETVVTSQEFCSLLDMVYTGKLPVGKHNFTRIIAAADSLQMFDVAVGCKNIFDELVQQAQPKEPLPLNEEQTDRQDYTLSGERVEAQEAYSQGGVGSDDRTSGCHSVSDNSVKNTEKMNGSDAVKKNTEGLTCEKASLASSNVKEGAIQLLSQKRDELLQILQHLQPWIKYLRTWDTLPTVQREIMLECFEGGPGPDVVFQRLLDRLKDEHDLSDQTLLKLLEQLKSLKHHLTREQEMEGNLGQASVCADKHAPNLSDYLSSVNNLSDVLIQAADKCKNEVLKEVLLVCKGEQGHVQTVKKLLSALSERGIEESSLLELIQEAGEGALGLNQLGESRNTGELVKLQTAGSEEEDGNEGEKPMNDVKRKSVVLSYSCQWCKKSFDYKCRLMRHRKRCALSPGKVQHCSNCPLVFPSLTALQQHCSEAHGGPPVKKKKTEPVSCDLCSKTFKHPSGLLYHRRTEHLEERPYVCEECGAKFAANSSLKNHMRLHTGEKPYQCKHCEMSFAVAAALSYHTKKKHAEGKMYCCQYCAATFAQSIELTRHVRTHTGDKPYVCRECGKGFKQANGLSVHLQSFHNVAEPHDCQKCRVSFGSLDELREHIQEVHPKELHQCPECSRIFSTAAQLEKHMNIHDGSKPYSCKSCNKSYQTLSGLWYHNRTTHPEVVTAEGSRPLSTVLRCKICNKAFCNRSSLFKHQITKHPDTHSSEGMEGKDTHTESSMWKCAYCPSAAVSEVELQQHVSSQHVSQQGAVFGCAVCSLTFASEAQCQHHFLSSHLQVIQKESSTQMVIQTQETSDEGTEHMEGLAQSQLLGSQQVFVAIGDGRETEAGSGIVAVNMEDLLTGRITLVCEENP